jgi:hypothetical protein
MSASTMQGSRLQFAIERIRFVRAYTFPLIESVKPDDWFRQPVEGVSHVAWQVGHLAVAQYHMGLVCVRGKQPQDASLVPAEFRELFGRGSRVEADAARYPKPSELRAVLDAVHERIPVDLAGLADAALDGPATMPHPAFPTKFAALVFCGEHEMIHTGQIGLLRRMLGYPPLR